MITEKRPKFKKKWINLSALGNVLTRIAIVSPSASKSSVYEIKEDIVFQEGKKIFLGRNQKVTYFLYAEIRHASDFGTFASVVRMSQDHAEKREANHEFQRCRHLKHSIDKL